jgi:hypothetical protein
MTTTTSRAAGWILAAGLVACLGTPSFATEPSPWPSTNGIVSTDNQQAAPNAASDQTGAATAQPDATDRSLAADQRPDDMTAATDPNATQVTATNDEGGGSDRASIVGKIFIAAGTLLTLGSAARMFMI